MKGSLYESQWRCVHCNPITTGGFCKSLALSANSTNHEQKYQYQIFGVDISIGRPKGSCRKEISPFPRFGTKAAMNFMFLPKFFWQYPSQSNVQKVSGILKTWIPRVAQWTMPMNIVWKTLWVSNSTFASYIFERPAMCMGKYLLAYRNGSTTCIFLFSTVLACLIINPNNLSLPFKSMGKMITLLTDRCYFVIPMSHIITQITQRKIRSSYFICLLLFIRTWSFIIKLPTCVIANSILQNLIALFCCGITWKEKTKKPRLKCLNRKFALIIKTQTKYNIFQ